MVKYSVFQINAKTDLRLSEALAEMKNNYETVLWINQKSEKEKNRLLESGDVVYLWESGNRKPRHLVARGAVLQTEELGKDIDMPKWQQAFYLDGSVNRSGPIFHKPMPRVAVKVEKWLEAGKLVDRARTTRHNILCQYSFLNGASNKYRGITIFDLPKTAAQALDQLAGW